MKYLSRSTPNISSSEKKSSHKSSSHSHHHRGSKDRKKDKDKKHHTKINKEVAKLSPTPLTTRGWRAQLAARFTRRASETGIGISSVEKSSGKHRSRKKSQDSHGSSKERIPSTLFCDVNFNAAVRDDITVAY
jgi:hypothetical protein